MSVGARNGSIAFQPRARLLKLIGEELISDEVVALAELVKNAHDADAVSVTVAFHGATAPGGTLTICDGEAGRRAADDDRSERAALLQRLGELDESKLASRAARSLFGLHQRLGTRLGKHAAAR